MALVYRRATWPLYSTVKTHSVVVVSCGDVHTESGSAGVDTVQAQGWSVVERKQAFAELEAAKSLLRTCDLRTYRFPVARACATWMGHVERIHVENSARLHG